MICPNCNQRWAPFDERDFKFTERGFQSLHDQAEHWRLITWNADNQGLCPGCKEELDRTWCFKGPVI